MVIACPVLFGFLFVSIAPVEYLAVSEFTRGNGFEGRAAEIEGKLALDTVEGTVGANCFHAFVALVHNQQVPMRILNPFQLVIVATKID